jgi:hypothetical protein
MALPESEPGGVDSTSLWVSLNGLPPGTPVTGSAHVSPGDSVDVQVYARFAAGNISIPVQEVLFIADEDGDGTDDPLQSVGVWPQSSSATGVSMPDAVVSKVIAYPNPFADAIRLRFLVSRPGSVRVDILDIAGRIVRSTSAQYDVGGPTSFDWDGRDGRGHTCHAGLYFVRIATPDWVQNARIIKLQ